MVSVQSAEHPPGEAGLDLHTEGCKICLTEQAGSDLEKEEANLWTGLDVQESYV